MKEHLKEKSKELNVKYIKFYCLTNRKIQLQVAQVTNIKRVVKEAWPQGSQLSRCASKTNTHIMQRLHSKILQTTVDTSCYIRNVNLHRDLRVPQEIKDFA